MTTKLCNQCDGEGVVDVLVSLHYDGTQVWRTEPCDQCDGSGEVEAIEDDEDDDDAG